MVTSAWVGIVVPTRQENKERMKINISTSLCFVVVDVSNVTGLKDLSRKKMKKVYDFDFFGLKCFSSLG